MWSQILQIFAQKRAKIHPQKEEKVSFEYKCPEYPILLCIVGTLAWGGSMAVTFGASDM